MMCVGCHLIRSGYSMWLLYNPRGVDDEWVASFILPGCGLNVR